MGVHTCPLCNSMALESTSGIQVCTGSNCSFKCPIGTNLEDALHLQNLQVKEYESNKPLIDAIQYCRGKMCSNCQLNWTTIDDCRFSYPWCKGMRAVIAHVKREKQLDELWETKEWFRKYSKDDDVAFPILQILASDYSDFEKTQEAFRN